MTYQAVDVLNVFFNHYQQKYCLGRLALKNRQIYFEYDESFIATGIQVSPFKLPLKSGVITSDDKIFEGLFGVFNDSLPDGWGRLLLDRQVEKYGINRRQLTALDRLAHVGHFGMGALSYEPEYADYQMTEDNLQLDVLAEETQLVLQGEQEPFFEDLLALNGSSAGARPKIVVAVSRDKKQIIHGMQTLSDGFSHWIIKFPSSIDPKGIAEMEYAYSLMAKAAGIEMPETYLFRGKKNQAYFGIKRFDRRGNQSIHMHSLCGLIHADHRTPSLDYEMILKVTQALTKNIQEVEKVFRLACFNVLAHNRDDHSKNFSYLLNADNEWQFAPAYDLTFSFGPGGEQSSLVMGEGKNPGVEQLIELGKKIGLKNSKDNIERVYDAISNWKEFASIAGVKSKTIGEIGKFFN